MLESLDPLTGTVEGRERKGAERGVKWIIRDGLSTDPGYTRPYHHYHGEDCRTPIK